MSAQPLELDFSEEETPAQILPNQPILTSHQSSWKSIHLAHHHQPPWELPEVSNAQHIIYLPNTHQTATVKCLVEGRLQETQFHTSEYKHGCFGILPANMPYELCWNVNVEFVHFYIEPAFLVNIAHESVNPDQVEFPLKIKEFDGVIYHLGMALKSHLETDRVGSCFYADSMATALSAHLIKHYSTRKPIFRQYDDGLSKLKLNHAIAYINEHLGENLSLTAIADELDMSQYYFCRLFKRSIGTTPHQYLIQRRIDRAKQLLSKPELTITAIALECGFNNQSHFAKYFRQHIGATPKQFRNS